MNFRLQWVNEIISLACPEASWSQQPASHAAGKPGHGAPARHVPVATGRRFSTRLRSASVVTWQPALPFNQVVCVAVTHSRRQIPFCAVTLRRRYVQPRDGSCLTENILRLITETAQLMLFREIITVYSHIRRKHTRVNRAGGTLNNPRTLKGYMHVFTNLLNYFLHSSIITFLTL
jgi:hypothetical protein